MSNVENELTDVRKMLAEKDAEISKLKDEVFTAHFKGYARALEDAEVVIRGHGASKKVIQKVRELNDHGNETEAQIREPKNSQCPA